MSEPRLDNGHVDGEATGGETESLRVLHRARDSRALVAQGVFGPLSHSCSRPYRERATERPSMVLPSAERLGSMARKGPRRSSNNIKRCPLWCRKWCRSACAGDVAACTRLHQRRRSASGLGPQRRRRKSRGGWDLRRLVALRCTGLHRDASKYRRWDLNPHGPKPTGF